MSRRVQRRVVRETDENSNLDEQEVLNWTKLPDDTVITIFSQLNYRDRASLSSTCRAWRALGKSPCLWQELDLGPHKFDASAASSLASRCQNLRKLRFRDSKSADAILNLQAKNLRKLSFDCCKKMTDTTLCALARRHKALECLQMGGYFARITSVAINVTASCCPRLEKLWISGICEVDADTINALATNCKNLTDVGFINCGRVDEIALGNLASVRFLSVAGINNIKWNLAVQQWSKLPSLIGLDVSRTDIRLDKVSGFFSSSYSLKVLCALCCPGLEADAIISSNDDNREGKVLLAVFTDILKGVAKLFNDTTPKNDGNIFLHWRNSKKDKKLGEMLKWLEWIISDAIVRVSQWDLCGLDNFWLNQDTILLLSFLQSAQEEVQERASTALAIFATSPSTTYRGNLSIYPRRAEAVIRGDGIRLLLNLAQSWREGLQLEAVKAISNLSLSAKVAKAVAEEGGISILLNLAGSVSRYVAEEATGALWNLSFSNDLKCAIDEAFGVKALVDLIYQWSKSTGGERVLEHVAGVLANLAADNRCCIDFASVGVVHALVSLTRTCAVKRVQEQAARALTNLASHEGANGDDSSLRQMSGALDALVQLTRSRHEGVRQEAASALWNLSYGDGNREAIAAAGGVEALVALASSCSNASRKLQGRAAGALWGLSDSEKYSIAVVRGGGVAPLIALAQSNAKEVHDTAAGALWTLASYPINALRIMEEGGIHALGHLCSSSSVSKRARFNSAMALAYMFDGRIDEIDPSVGTSKSLGLDGHRRLAMKHIEAFVMTISYPKLFSDAAKSLDPESVVRITERARIKEVGQLKCSRREIERFVSILQNPSPGLKSCAAFALFQFTAPGGRFAVEHMNLLRDAGAPQVLRLHEGAPLEAKIFTRIILRNLEQHHTGSLV